MRVPRPALVFLFAIGCFDPLYELGFDRSWTVCCRAGRIDTCECLDAAQCAFELTACAGGTCVERGMCVGGTGGGGGAGGGGGGGIGGTGGGFVIGDAGFAGDAGNTPTDAGSTADAGTPADSGTLVDAGTTPPDAGTLFTLWETCCLQGRVTSCECSNGHCTAPPFTSCAQGRCVASGVSCSP